MIACGHLWEMPVKTEKTATGDFKWYMGISVPWSDGFSLYFLESGVRFWLLLWLWAFISLVFSSRVQLFSLVPKKLAMASSMLSKVLPAPFLGLVCSVSLTAQRPCWHFQKGEALWGILDWKVSFFHLYWHIFFLIVHWINFAAPDLLERLSSRKI